MPLYRKKDIVVIAHELTPQNVNMLAEWCKGVAVIEIDAEDPTKTFVGVNIPTLEGVMRASEGDYIIQGVAGEFYPCKPGIFIATYDPA